MSVTAMTELEAVNLMLTTIGEAPVNTIEGSNLLDVSIARQVLKEVLTDTCEPGWHFNTETNVVIAPNEDGEIWVPDNALRVDTMDSSIDVVLRGKRLYDKKNHTYTFDQALSLELVLGLEFEEVPQAVRQYVAIRAARVFQRRVLGSDSLEALTQTDEMLALTKLQNYDTDTADYNLLTGSMDIYNIIAR